MTPLPLLDHPVVREGAAELAKERWAILQSIVDHEEAHTPTSWDHVPEYGKRRHIEVNARLLCDLSRPASMDFWSRWGMNHAIRAAGDEAYRDPSLVPDIMRRWNDLRNDPEALAAAILATLTPATP